MVAEVTQDELEGRAQQLELPGITIGDAEVTFRVTRILEELDLIPDGLFAKTLGVAEQTLAGWRSGGQGPRYVKLGKGVFYRREDVKDWISSNVVNPER